MPGKLTYFDVNGRADCIRMMLNHAGAQYEDCRLSFPQFGEMKQQGCFPMGSVPVWDEDGFCMPDGCAILRMLAIRHGYYSDKPMIIHNIDSIVDFAEGLMKPWSTYTAPLLGGGALADDEKADEFINKYVKELVRVVGARLDGHGKKFIAGTDRPTIADFKAFTNLSTAMSDMNPASAFPESVQTKIKSTCMAHDGFKRWVMGMKQECSTLLANRPARPV